MCFADVKDEAQRDLLPDQDVNSAAAEASRLAVVDGCQSPNKEGGVGTA